MRIPPASELKLPSVEWLWPGYLPLGHLVLLDGDPGLGKSLITLDLAARVTTGRPFPNNAAAPEPGNVLLLCAEDPAGVILARLGVLGADLTRIFLWPREQGDGLPLFPAGIHRLDAVVEETQARLIVIDPLLAMLDRRVNLGSDASVRAALNPLALLADRRRCVLGMVRHLNKDRQMQALYRGSGSIAFVAACRLAWLAFAHPQEPGQFLLAQNKNNYGPLQPSLVYSLAEGGVTWHGASPLTAADLSAARPNPKLPRARAFWKEVLQAGPRRSQEVHALARRQGISSATLRRAREDLRIRCPRQFENGRAVGYFMLERQEMPSQPGFEKVDAWLRSLG